MLSVMLDISLVVLFSSSCHPYLGGLIVYGVSAFKRITSQPFTVHVHSLHRFQVETFVQKFHSLITSLYILINIRTSIWSIYFADFASKFIAILAQKGKSPIDADKNFFNASTEDVSKHVVSFIVYSRYDVTCHYNTWVAELLRKTTTTTTKAGSVQVAVRFEHEIVSVGRTSHVWQTTAFDVRTGGLLMTFAQKYVLVNLKTRSSIPLESGFIKLARSYLDGRREAIDQSVTSISVGDVNKHYARVFSRRWTIEERNIDLNGHTNYLVYIRMATNTLVDYLDTLTKQRGSKHTSSLRSLQFLYEGESLVGENLDISVHRRHGLEKDVMIVQVFSNAKRITFCKYVVMCPPVAVIGHGGRSKDCCDSKL